MTITMTAGGIANGDVICTQAGYPIARVSAHSKAQRGKVVRCCMTNCATGEIESLVDYPATQTVHVDRER